MTRVLITGLSTYWGGNLAKRLEADESIELIVGVDTKPPTVELERTEFIRVGETYNVGGNADRRNIDVPGIDSWARGYRFRGNDGVRYRTVMAYAPGTRIPYYSNPNVRFKGAPTGLPAGSGCR